MGACLAAHVNAPRPGLGDEGDPAPGADVDDVKGAPRLLGEGDGAADGLLLRDGRARSEVVAPTCTPFGRCSAGKSAGDRVILGVDSDDPT